MKATSPPGPGGISRRNRVLLERLHRGITKAFDAADAASVLGIGPEEASNVLVYLARRGWLSRVRRGLYVLVPLDARQSGQWVEDSWVVADRAFAPCYIGGWSACEYWDLTEQLFRTLLVVTGRRVRHRDVVIQGLPFHLTVRPKAKLFGLAAVWRGQAKVEVSDPTRTVIDILDDPRIGGGMRTVADVVRRYFRGDHRDDRLVVEYGDRLGNRAVFKRLGYLIESSGVDAPELIAACHERRSQGLVALDPAVGARGVIVRRWGVRANVTTATGDDGW